MFVTTTVRPSTMYKVLYRLVWTGKKGTQIILTVMRAGKRLMLTTGVYAGQGVPLDHPVLQKVSARMKRNERTVNYSAPNAARLIGLARSLAASLVDFGFPLPVDGWVVEVE